MLTKKSNFKKRFLFLKFDEGLRFNKNEAWVSFFRLKLKELICT